MPMFKAIRVTILLLILIFVAGTTWLSQARSTDWNNSLWVKIYPINGDGSDSSQRYIDRLRVEDFSSIEEFFEQEVARYGRTLARPIRMELGTPVDAQPPVLPDALNTPAVMWWSVKTRWWANKVAGDQDSPPPDVRIFVRYHALDRALDKDYVLENSVGLQKGMVGIVNAFASRQQRGSNHVIIAHEFLHTLGATDKYEGASGLPMFPDGFGDPAREPLYPQRVAEIMGGRIALAEDDAMIPRSLKYVVIGEATAREIGLTE